MYCKNSVYQITTATGTIILGTVHKMNPSHLVLDNVVETMPVPGKPGLYNLRKLNHNMHLCNYPFLMHAIDEKSPFWAPYHQERSGITMPDKDNIRKFG